MAAEAERALAEKNELIADFDAQVRRHLSPRGGAAPLALPCLALPCLALPCLALPCLALICLDLH